MAQMIRWLVLDTRGVLSDNLERLPRTTAGTIGSAIKIEAWLGKTLCRCMAVCYLNGINAVQPYRKSELGGRAPNHKYREVSW